MKFLELKHNISGKELFTVQARYRFYMDIKQCTRTMALGTELTESQSNIRFCCRSQKLGDGDLQDQGTGSSPSAGFVGDAWMGKRRYG
jgi:hypothetical protein